MILKNKHHSAFTMIELLFVIVVIGILASLAIPRMDRDIRQEAADNILSSIRYTQHMALTDNKTDPFDGNWQKEFWQIRFSTTTTTNYIFYLIGSDTSHAGGIGKAESAIDPANGKYLYHLNTEPELLSDESSNLLIGKLYDVTSINGAGGCTDIQYIGFDQLGRPHTTFSTNNVPNYKSYINSDCNLTFNSASFDAFTIIISKETGYAYIDGQPDS